jgi:hypothetical protein
MADKHNRKPRHIETNDTLTGDAPDSSKIAIPAARMQNYLRNWKQQGQIFSYSGNHSFTLNPGFADVKDNSSNDADCEYYVICHGPPKTDESTNPKRLLGGVLIPWRYRTTYTQNNRGTVASTPTIQWTAPPYETFSEVLVDGDAEAAGVGAWAGINATFTQSLNVAATSTSDAGARQTILTIGKKYVVRGYARYVSGTGNFPLVNAGGTTWSGVRTHTDWQYFRFEVASAASTLFTLYCWNPTAGSGSCQFDNVEVLEATTVTPTASTMYQKNGENQEYGGYLKYTDSIIDGDMELNNTTNWGGAASSTLSKTTTSPQEGTRALRITANAGQATGNLIYTYQGIVVTTTDVILPGRRYLLTGYARSDGTEVPMINLTTNTFGIIQTLWSGTASTSWQFFQIDFVASEDTVGGLSINNIQLLFRLGTGPAAGTEYVDFDNIRLLEVDGRANNRSKGATQLFTDWDMQKSGVTAFTDTRCTSSKDTSIYYRGSQSLNLAATVGTLARYFTSFSPGLTVTNEYRITGYARSDGKSVPYLAQDTANSTLWVGNNSQTWQFFDVNFTAVQTAINLLGGAETRGQAVNSNGTEQVWFDNVEVWEVDHDYTGWRLDDKKSKRIVLGNGATSDNFFYVPPSDGGFCVGKLTTKNIQTATLGIWSTPDTDLTLEQKVISERELLPKTSILGYGPSTEPQDIGSIYNLIGFTGNDYEDGVEQMTRLCLFQWGHPVGYYATGSLSQTSFIGGMPIKISPRNLTGGTGTDTVNVDMAFVITTNGAAGGSSIQITFSSGASSPASDRVFTFTSDVTTTLLTTADEDTASALPVYAIGDDVSVIIDFNGAGTQEVTIHTVSLWETSEF